LSSLVNELQIKSTSRKIANATELFLLFPFQCLLVYNSILIYISHDPFYENQKDNFFFQCFFYELGWESWPMLGKSIWKSCKVVCSL